MKRYIFLVAIILSMSNLIAWADSDYEYIRIARISYMEGHVSFQHTSDVEWTAASINLPLQPGDRIYTGPQGRAEIEFDEGSILHLAEHTDIQFLSLNEEIIQIRILTGLSSLTVLSDANFEVDTPAAAFVVLRKGAYRFDTQDNGDTDAIVRKGSLEAISHRFVRRIDSGEQMFVTADNNSSYRISWYDRRDGWDEWTDRRNADAVARASRQYLPETVYVGASDLDRYGRWVTVESYGTAWVPYSVDVSWSPYSVGRWCYRPVWGWTWVSYEPWGWLPYHYGRWHRSVQYGWCWLPGPSFSFHFWSPGLVTFYSGPSWVSWVPLGPGDYYSINNYYYNRHVHHHYVVELRRLHYRDPGDSHNRRARDAYRTVDIAHFRDGGSRAVATKKGYRKIEQPWNQGSLVRERLAVQPSSRSFSADPDRVAVRSSVAKPRPAQVYAKPTTISSKRNEYVRVSNANVSQETIRRARSTGSSSSSNPGNNDRDADSGRNRLARDPASSGGSPARQRSGTGTLSDSRTDRSLSSSSNRSENTARSRNSSDTINRSQSGDAVRSNSPAASRQGSDFSGTVRSATPRNSTGSNSGRSSTPQSVRQDSSGSIPSGRSSSEREPSGSSARERQSISRSSGQSGISGSSDSSSRSRIYSTPSTSSRSGSPASSGNRQRSYSTTPRIDSTQSSPRSSTRESTPATRSSGQSSVSGSSGSSSRTYSAPSTSSRSGSSASSGSRSRSSSSVSSGRSSSNRSSSTSSGSSSNSNSSSGSRRATRR